MNELIINKKEFAEYLAWSLIITILAWSIGFGVFIHQTKAANLTSVSDTLTDSNPTSTSNHTIVYTNATGTSAGQTIVITFDPNTSLFTGVGTIVFADISFTGGTLVTTCTASPNELQFTSTSTNSVTFTVCASDVLTSGTKTFIFSNNKITNPGTELSYVIRINGSQDNNADTRVAIVKHVIVTAAVDTSFSFTVAGVATGTSINGATTTYSTVASPTSLAFGTLPINAPVTLGQQLTVATNAKNGFIVTVVENQDLASQTGAKIYLFANAGADATPHAWSAPSSTLNVPTTYGHIGLTSDDADLNGGEFNGSLFAGNFQSTSSRQIFNSTGTSDGTTQNIGLAKVAYRIQIGALQAAANDYTNILTYVATPTF